MLQTSLASLLYSTGLNKRGICAAIAVPLEAIASMPTQTSLMKATVSPSDSDLLLAQITLNAGFEWLDLSKPANQRLSFQEKPDITSQGPAYTSILSMKLPNDTYEAAKVKRAYENRQWIIIVKEKTGAWRLMGSQQRGADFTTDFNSGEMGSGSNEDEVQFKWQSLHPCFYVA
jgi:hypothetical protein